MLSCAHYHSEVPSLGCCSAWAHWRHAIDAFQITICSRSGERAQIEHPAPQFLIYYLCSSSKDTVTFSDAMGIVGESVLCDCRKPHISLWLRKICSSLVQKGKLMSRNDWNYDCEGCPYGKLHTHLKCSKTLCVFSGSSTKTATQRMSVSSTEQWFIATPSSPLWPLLKPWRVSRSTTATLQEW